MSCQYFFTEISHADRGTINMKHIQGNFRSKACVSPAGGLRGWGSKGQNSTFSEQCHVAYQIKGNHKCSSMVANILLPDSYPTPYPSPPKVGVKRSISSFSDHGHVAYQIKKKKKCSNMVPNILPAAPPLPRPYPQPTLTLGIGSKFNFFRTWSCCKSN